MSPKQLLHRILVWSVVSIMLVSVAACGPDNTPTTPPQPIPTQTTLPQPTNTPIPTNTPQPTPTATEIPLLLPTSTPVPPPPPQNTSGLLPPTIPAAPTFTALPTITPTVAPTQPPPPTATPIPSVRLNIVVNYSVTGIPGYSYPTYFPSPDFATSCIAQTYYKALPTPTPAATQAGTTGTVAPPTPTRVVLYDVATDDYWYTLLRSRYIFPSGGGGSVNPTAPPVNASTPFSGPLPPGVVGAPTATPNPPVPYTAGSETILSSLFITDTLASLTDIAYNKPELMLMWNVMNNVTRQLIDPGVDPKAYQQSYEAALNQIVNAVLRANSLSRIIIGNVPDLAGMRYFRTCFTDDQLQQVQRSYNDMFAALAARYPRRVYIARLDLIDIRNHPQWIYVPDGLRFTQLGAPEVAAAFGRVFQTIRYR